VRSIFFPPFSHLIDRQRGARGISNARSPLRVISRIISHFFELHSQIAIYLLALLFALQISVAFIKKEGESESESGRGGGGGEGEGEKKGSNFARRYESFFGESLA